MRKTLHTLPEQIAAIAHTATRHFRERDARRLAVNAGISQGEVMRIVEAIRLLLAETGAMGHRRIEEIVATRVSVPIRAVRIALKFAWESGHVVYRNVSAYWNREHRTFGLARVLSPAITTIGDKDEAADALVTLYFERYGPASIQDAAWWSGLSKGAIARSVARADRPVLQVMSPWCTDPLYLFEEQLTQHARRTASCDSVDFLAHEDVALKAYHQTRQRYLASLPSSAVFNQIGEALPTILKNGHVIGLWRWSHTNRCVEWELFTRVSSVARACLSRADELTSTLRDRYDVG